MNVLPYLKGIRRYMLIGFLSGMASSYLISFVPIFHSKIMETLLTNNKEDIYKYMYLYYSYSFVGNILAGIRGYIFTTYIQILSSRIKKNILLSFFNNDVLSFGNKSSSEVANILINDSNQVSDLYCLNANIIFRDISQFATTAYILTAISSELFFVNISIAIIQLMIEHNYHKYVYENSVAKCNAILLRQNEIIHDYTQKTDTYKALGMEEEVYRKWDIDEKTYTSIKATEASYYGIKVIINQSINQFMVMLLILFGIWRNFAYNDIMIFILYNPSLCSILRDLMHIRTDITKNRKATANINEVFEYNAKEVWEGTYVLPFTEFSPKIEIKDLSFSYDNNNDNDNKCVLSNINLKFDSGKIFGIQGKSGRGKSTLLKILLGLYRPYKGTVLFDGVKLHDIDKKHFYSKIVSFVGQEPVLFTGTTYENIVTNIDNYDKDLFESFQDLIKDIPEHTKMSGGQRQRIAICRAFMRKPKILLLDEPTSALDVESEEMILRMIKRINLRLNITVIIVSHKNSTLKICDNIFKL